MDIAKAKAFNLASQSVSAEWRSLATIEASRGVDPTRISPDRFFPSVFSDDLLGDRERAGNS
jgi:hypothetical protein